MVSKPDGKPLQQSSGAWGPIVLDDCRESLRIRVWGARGSLPVCGESFRIFGGNTTCVEIRCGDQILLFDAGSGLLPAGLALQAEGTRTAHLFFSHCHYDHIIGLPFFSDAVRPQSLGRDLVGPSGGQDDHRRDDPGVHATALASGR